MNKKIIIIAAVVILVVILVIIISLVRGKQTPAGMLTIPGTNQQTVTTNDFTAHPAVKYDRSVVIYYDSNYGIQYDSVSNQFQITFTTGELTGLAKYRADAEALLLSKLGISASEACKLNVKEHIQQTPAMNLTTYDYPLSFCSAVQNDFPNQ